MFRLTGGLRQTPPRSREMAMTNEIQETQKIGGGITAVQPISPA